MSELTEETLDAFCDVIFSDPKRRTEFMKLMKDNKKAFDNTGRTSKNKRLNTPKTNRNQLINGNIKDLTVDSPTSIFRRMLLHQEKRPAKSIDLTLTQKKPFNKILEGVRAYIEVVVDGVSHSDYIKLFVKDMGAEILDKLTNRVTHVIFLDGMYTTYRHANLVKAHLVSIIWLDMCRKNSSKVCEKYFPAIDIHVSEFEVQKVLESIKDEYTSNKDDALSLNTKLSFNKNKSNSITAFATPDRRKTFNASTSRVPQEVLITNFVTLRKKTKSTVRNLQYSSSITEDSIMSSLYIPSSNKSPINEEIVPLNYNDDKSLSKTESLDSIDVVPKTQSTQNTPNINNSSKITSTETNSNNISRLRKKLFEKVAFSSSTENSTNSNEMTEEEFSTNLNGIINDSDNYIPSADIVPRRLTRKSTVYKRRQTSVAINLRDEKSINIAKKTDDNNMVDKSSHTFNQETKEKSIIIPPQNNKNKCKTICYSSSERSVMSSLQLTATTSNSSSSANNISFSSNYPSTIESTSSAYSPIINAKDTLLKTKTPKKLSRKKITIKLTPKRKCLDEHTDTTDNVAVTKRRKRKLYDPNESMDKYNINYDEEFDKFNEETNVSNRSKKTFDSSNLPPLCLADKYKSDLNFIQNYVNININNKLSIINNKKPDLVKKRDKKTTNNAIESIKPSKNNNLIRKDSNILKRRSTMEFQVIPSQKITKKRKPRKKYITYTQFQKENVKEFERVVKTLGEFHIEFNVTDKTTHLIVPFRVRTLNVLRAISRGCWILTKNWLQDSMRNGSWLPEEEYEFTEFSPAVQQCRLQRQMFGSSFVINIFANCGSIYINKKSKPNCKYLEELVTLCKGKIANTKNRSTLIIGEYDINKICLMENWILDSIMYNEKMDFKKYIIDKRPNSPCV